MNRKCRLADFVLDGTKDTRLLKQDVAKFFEDLRLL